MIARHKKPRHDLIVVLHLKSCGAAENSLRGCIRCAIIEVATPRLHVRRAMCNSAHVHYLSTLCSAKFSNMENRRERGAILFVNPGRFFYIPDSKLKKWFIAACFYNRSNVERR